MSDPTKNADQFSNGSRRNLLNLDIGGPKSESILNSSMKHVHKEYSNSPRLKSGHIQELLFQNDHNLLGDSGHSQFFVKTEENYDFPNKDQDSDMGTGALSELLFGCEEVDIESLENDLKKNSEGVKDSGAEKDGSVNMVAQILDCLEI